jgi:hypothetical protein
MASAFIDHALYSLQISRKLLLHYCLQPTLDYIFDGRVHADSNPRYRIDGVVSEIQRHFFRCHQGFVLLRQIGMLQRAQFDPDGQASLQFRKYIAQFRVVVPPHPPGGRRRYFAE